MPPAAVLRVLVQAAGIASTNRDLMRVHSTLEDVSAQADRALASIRALGSAHATPTVTLDSDVERTLRQAQGQLELFDRSSADAAIGVDSAAVRPEIARAAREVDEFGRKRATVTLKVDNSIAARALRETHRETDKLAVAAYRAEHGMTTMGNGAGGATGGTDALRASIGPLSGGISTLSSIALGLGVALLAIVGPAIAVAAALAPLSGLAAAVGAGAIAGAQGLGVLKLATAGVMDALKEQTTAHAAAGAGATKQAGQEQAAASRIASAQEGVRSAKNALTQATQQLGEAQRSERAAIAALPAAYAEARRGLTDFAVAARNSGLALASARMDARDARAALVALLAGPSPRDLADAHLAVADALRSERSAALDLADATRSLNDLLAPPAVLDVADAQDAVADSLRGQAHAAQDLLDATAAVADAQGALAALPAAATDAQRATAATALAHAELQLADAQNAVGDAARATERATGRLAALQAPPEALAVAQAQDRVASAQAAVEAATRGTADAQAALNAVRGPSGEAVARARLDVAQAEQAVTRATIENARATVDLAAAQRLGVRGAPSVVAAREAVRSATRATADAEDALTEADHRLVLAMRAVGDAQRKNAVAAVAAGAAAQNLNEKLDALPPAARAFVLQLVAMKPLLDELRATAAAGLFPGVTEGLTAAARNFEPVRRVVDLTASALGGLARSAGELVGGAAFGRDIELVGGRNAKMLTIFGNAGLHLVDALRHIIVTAGPLTMWLARLAGGWAQNADEAAAAGRENGKLTAFFEHTWRVLERVGSIVAHVTKGLFGLGSVGAKSGRDILASIDAAAGRFDRWANSDRGRAQLLTFFRESKELASGLAQVLSGLAKGFGILTLRMLPVAAALKLLGPYTDEAVIAFVAFKVATMGVNAVMAIFNLRLLTNRAIIVSHTAAMVATRAAVVAWTAAQWLLNVALTANPIGLVVVAIAALVAGLIYAYKHSDTFRAIVTTAFRAVSDAFGWLLEAAQTAFGWLKDNWPLVLAILTGPIGLAALYISKHVDEIVGFFEALPGRIVDAIEVGAALFAGAVTWIKDRIVGGIKAYAGLYVDVGRWLVNRVVDGVKAMAGALADAAGWIKNRVIEGIHAVAAAFTGAGAWVINRVAEGIKTITEALASVGGWIKNRVVEFIQAVPEALIGAGRWIINRVAEGVTTVTDALGGIGGWIKNRVVEYVHSAADGFTSLGRWIIDKIVDGLKSGANLFVDFVNSLIGVINKIPGVDIGKVGKLRTGGTFNAAGVDASTATSAGKFARGGAYGMTGGMVNGPIAIMGEEAPRYPEYVIPTNPAYRHRAQLLATAAASQVGVPGFKLGGVLGDLTTGGLWDLVEGGAKSIVGSLPGVDDLPEWIRGLGVWAIRHVKKWIADKLSGLFSDGRAPNLAGVMKAATMLAAKHFPYVYGGGHGGFSLAPVDCSGGVSYALHGGHMLGRPLTTDGLKVYGESGEGRAITIGVRGSTGRNAHTMMRIADRYFESGSGHGWAQTSGWSGHFPIHRHPPGFAAGGMLAALAEQAFAPEVVGWGLRRGGLLGVLHNGTSYVPQTGAYLLERGERVAPVGDTGDTFEVEISVNGSDELAQVIAGMIDVRIKRNDRDIAATWKAGRTP